MGNMSNPCINRWGLKSFWHHYWYSDTKYAQYLQQDKLFSLAVYTYLTYGTNDDSRQFWKRFWFKTSTPPAIKEPSVYHRWAVAVNEVYNERVRYRFRKNGPEVFWANVTIMRFDSTVILNFYWFQPDKGANRRANRFKLHPETSDVQPSSTSESALIKSKTLLRLPTVSYSF